MKYSILGFNQQEVLKCRTTIDVNGKEKEVSVDVIDLLILQCVADFMNRQRIYKYMINDKIYFSVQYNALMEDLPILNIGKQALRDRIDKLVLFCLLEKEVVKNELGTFVVFRMGSRYEQLVYRNEEGGVYQTTHGVVSNYTPKDTSTINYNKEKEDESSSKKESGIFVVPTIEEIDAHIKEKGYHFSGIDFWNFYESKGWMVGKNKMKKWTAACVTWERKYHQEGPSLFDTPVQQPQKNTLEINNQLYR